MGLKQALNTIVVLCAGGSRRFISGGTGKLHTIIADRPLLLHAIMPWIRQGRRWIFVTSPTDSNTEQLVMSAGLSAHFEHQPEPVGITDAILRAAPMAGPFFTVLLGDCIMRGRFEFDVQHECGVGVWPEGQSNDIKNNYGVEIGEGRICRALEKPDTTSGLTCGMGVYFFNRELTDFCRAAFLDSGGSAHITSILNMWAAQEGKPLAPIWFKGEYVNVNTAEALPLAETIVNGCDQNDPTY